MTDAWPTQVEGDRASVVLAGEIDLAVAPALRAHLGALCDGGARSVELEASGVTFIDSAGLSVLVAIDRRCREGKGGLTLRSPSPVVLRTLQIAGLLDVFPVVE